MGNLLRDLGDLEGAKALYKRALAIFKQFLPEDHQNIKIAQANLVFVEQEIQAKSETNP